MKYLYFAFCCYCSLLYAAPPKDLEVRLIAHFPECCLQSKDLEFDVILTNTSDKSIEIAKEGVYYSFEVKKSTTIEYHFTNTEKDIPDSVIVPFFAARQSYSELEPTEWRIIPSGSSMIIPIRLEKIHNFFNVAGLYEFKIRYGHYIKQQQQSPPVFAGSIDSNTVLINIISCKE